MGKVRLDGSMAVGDIIRTQREARGLLQRDLAERIGVTPSAITRWEQGSRVPSIELFNRAMRALDADLFVISKEAQSGLRVALQRRGDA